MRTWKLHFSSSRGFTRCYKLPPRLLISSQFLTGKTTLCSLHYMGLLSKPRWGLIAIRTITMGFIAQVTACDRQSFCFCVCVLHGRACLGTGFLTRAQLRTIPMELYKSRCVVDHPCVCVSGSVCCVGLCRSRHDSCVIFCASYRCLVMVR